VDERQPDRNQNRVLSASQSPLCPAQPAKGAKTKEVSLASDLINLSRGGGYECDEYCLAIVHCMTLYMYSLLI
jgi:hypothetical protein